MCIHVKLCKAPLMIYCILSWKQLTTQTTRSIWFKALPVVLEVSDSTHFHLMSLELYNCLTLLLKSLTSCLWCRIPLFIGNMENKHFVWLMATLVMVTLCDGLLQVVNKLLLPTQPIYSTLVNIAQLTAFCHVIQPWLESDPNPNLFMQLIIQMSCSS